MVPAFPFDAKRYPRKQYEWVDISTDEDFAKMIVKMQLRPKKKQEPTSDDDEEEEEDDILPMLTCPKCGPDGGVETTDDGNRTQSCGTCHMVLRKDGKIMVVGAEFVSKPKKDTTPAELLQAFPGKEFKEVRVRSELKVPPTQVVHNEGVILTPR